MVESVGYRSVYEVTGGKFTLTRFERDGKGGRKLVRENFKTGEQFIAYNYEVPSGFMDLLKVLGPAPDERPVPVSDREVPTEDRTPNGANSETKRKRPPVEADVNAASGGTEAAKEAADPLPEKKPKPKRRPRRKKT